jgi:micrococcal nuclease
MFLRLAFLSLILISAPAFAQPDGNYSELRPDTTAVKVQKVIDPLTFLGTNGTIYKLSGLDVPGLDTGGSDIVEQATRKTTELIAEQDLKVYITKDQTKGRQNRMGQTLIHAERKKDNLWIQGQLVADGLARVRTTPSNPEMSKQLLALEETARAGKKGLWADPQYGVYGVDLISSKANSFVIVEGRVFSVANRNNETFLNFGPDWKKDFTIGISPEMRRQISKQGLNFAALVKRTVRVRGFIEDRNGPFITLDHPEQLEIIGGTIPTLKSAQTGGTTGGMRSFKTPEKPVTPEINKPEPPTADGKKASPPRNLLDEGMKALFNE